MFVNAFRSSGPVSFGFAELENNNDRPAVTPGTEYPATTAAGVDAAQQTLKNELQVAISPRLET